MLGMIGSWSSINEVIFVMGFNPIWSRLKTIKPTFYEQLFNWFPFAKNLQTQTVSTAKNSAKHFCAKKAACKM
jgi:hypothetical protein